MSDSDAKDPVSAAPVIRKLAAILSADVKGYSRLMSTDEVATIRRLSAYRERMTGLIAQHRGRVVDSPGDNLLADFGSAVDALQGAVAIQDDLHLQNAELPVAQRMEYRIGINLGDVVVEGERIYGDGVNIAARLESLADGGGIRISGAVHEQVENKLTLSYTDLGEQTVKNIARPVRVYRVVLASSPAWTEAHPAPALALPDKPSIVVLPFLNLSGDAEQEYFSEGITEDLITDLSKVSGLFVISRNSAFMYKGNTVRPEAISKELGVRYLLEGSVRKANSRVRITAQLIDATTNYHLWSERYDRELEDIFAVQDEVTRKIVAALEVKLTKSEQARIANVPTNNLEAYDSFLRGLERHTQRTREANTQARQMFERAVELDPQFAGAYAMLGRTYLTGLAFQWEDRVHGLAKLQEFAARAVALDDGLSIAHESLAYSYLGRKEHGQAIAAAERATKLDPNSADALVTLGEILCFAGRAGEAVEWVEKAMRLNPRYPTSYLWVLGQSYFFNGRIEDAIVTFKRVITHNPDHVTGHRMLAIIYGELGQIVDAQHEAREILRISPQFTLANVRDRTPYQDPKTIERIVGALMKAGFV
ncbi:MAG: adenylate/guanylate cyclase domain-containing protein [Gammaproteobacteria bacterium]|nr:adenylate/guanylate cyclase domain-containing protein [Gammaproteobacteria bacterium]